MRCLCCLVTSAACSTDCGKIRGGAYQLVEDAAVQRHLSLAALEEVVVVVLEAVGVGLELVEAVGVDVLDTIAESVNCVIDLWISGPLELQPNLFPRT